MKKSFPLSTLHAILIALLFVAKPSSAQLPGCHCHFNWSVDQQTFNVQFNDSSWFDVGPQNTTWTWDFGDGGNSQLQNPSHVYAGDGVYEACLTVTNCSSIPGTCCSDTWCDTIRIDGVATGFENNTVNENLIHIFPNPFTDICSILFSSNMEASANANLYDVQGKLVCTFSIKHPAEHISFDAGPLLKGMYILQIITNDGMVIHTTLVKQ